MGGQSGFVHYVSVIPNSAALWHEETTHGDKNEHHQAE